MALRSIKPSLVIVVLVVPPESFAARIASDPLACTTSFEPGLVEPIPTFPLLRTVTAVVPNGARTMLPVVELPTVSVWRLVVPSTPRPLSVVALLPELAEIEAVGVPPLTLSSANFAEAVALLPISKSRVSLTGDTVPEAILQ